MPRGRHGLGGPHGGHHGGGGHHHGGGGGRAYYGGPGPWWYGYPEPLYTDCVRDPLDLRRCLPPPAAYAGFGDAGSSISNLVVVGGVLLGILLLTKKKR